MKRAVAWLARQRAPGGLGALLVLAALPFLVGRFYVRLAAEMLIWGLLAMSLDLLMGYLGLASFAHAALAGLGAYTMGLTVKWLGWGLWPSLGAGILATGLIAGLMGAFSVRVRDIYFGIVTLCFGMIFYIVVWTWTSVTGGEDGLIISRPPLTVGPFRWPLSDLVVFYYFATAVGVAAYLLCRRIVQSPLGRVFQAIRENEERTQFLGYNTNRFKIIGTAISGMFAALSGCLFLLMGGVIGADFLFPVKSGAVVIWALVGGMGTLIGPIVGAAAITFLTDLFSTWTENYLILVGLIFILAVLFLPHGLCGMVRTLMAESAPSRHR